MNEAVITSPMLALIHLRKRSVIVKVTRESNQGKSRRKNFRKNDLSVQRGVLRDGVIIVFDYYGLIRDKNQNRDRCARPICSSSDRSIRRLKKKFPFFSLSRAKSAIALKKSSNFYNFPHFSLNFDRGRGNF